MYSTNPAMVVVIETLVQRQKATQIIVFVALKTATVGIIYLKSIHKKSNIEYQQKSTTLK